MSDDSEEVPTWPPVDYPAEWPDVMVRGLTVVRSEVAPIGPSSRELSEGTTWTLLPGTAESEPHPPLPAVVGQLTVRSGGAFAGVVVAAILRPRTRPRVVDDDYTSSIVERYGLWISGAMYDFAAAHMRAAVSSSAYALEIPLFTPMPTIETHRQTTAPKSKKQPSAKAREPRQADDERAPAKKVQRKPKKRAE